MSMVEWKKLGEVINFEEVNAKLKELVEEGNFIQK